MALISRKDDDTLAHKPKCSKDELTNRIVDILRDALPEDTRVTKRLAAVALSAVYTVMAEALREDQSVQIPGIGVLYPATCAGRTYRMPDQQVIKAAPRRTYRLRATDTLSK